MVKRNECYSLDDSKNKRYSLRRHTRGHHTRRETEEDYKREIVT